LYDAISELNASEKAIITMYLEDFSYSEIAFVTDITENYVGVKLNRIKKKLSKIIDEDHGV
jgi:RNA polymerase sigma-70 factor (ECF subfamily)